MHLGGLGSAKETLHLTFKPLQPKSTLVLKRTLCARKLKLLGTGQPSQRHLCRSQERTNLIHQVSFMLTGFPLILIGWGEGIIYDVWNTPGSCLDLPLKLGSIDRELKPLLQMTL